MHGLGPASYRVSSPLRWPTHVEIYEEGRGHQLPSKLFHAGSLDAFRQRGAA
jgi:hypothetical protein